MSSRGVVHGLCNILYYFHSSNCNSHFVWFEQLHRCFECLLQNHVIRQVKTTHELSRDLKNEDKWLLEDF